MTGDDLPATVLKDVGDSKLSVFEVDTEETEHLAAIAFKAKTSTEFREIQYALIDSDDLGPLHIEVTESPGDTPSSAANELHREFLHLTARKACDLAHVIGTKRHFRTIFKKVVETKTNEYCKAGDIDCDSLTAKLRSKIPDCK